MTYRNFSGSEKLLFLGGGILGADFIQAVQYLLGVRLGSMLALVNVILAAASVTVLCYAGVTWPGEKSR